MTASTDIDLRALNLFGRLMSYPGNIRFRDRLLKREPDVVLLRLSQLEAGHLARAAMPTQMPDWAAAVLVNPPGRIGPFHLTERIGLGGMGDVWRGERDDGLFDQVVAIKLIKTNLDERAATAFESERRILAQLDHPDIVRLTDGGVTEDGLPYLIMDYVEGVPFDLAVAHMVPDQRIRLFVQVAHVVQYAHGKLVAHADLKPSNILVDVHGRVRLLDFGISELLISDQTASVPKGAMTLAFASPQRQAGAAPSIADDVYALGKLLELIVGHTHDADLKAIISKATADSETARYAATTPFITDLEQWQRGLPVTAQPDTLRYRTAKFVKRNRTLVLAATIAILGLLATSVYATIASFRAERARAEASARYDDAHGIANYLMFDLMERMANQPRSLAIRSDMAKTAQHYLDRLSHVSNADDNTRMDTAKGYWRLAEFQSKSGHPNLGQPDAARENLKTALRLSSALTGGQSDVLKANILLDRESIAANSDNDLVLSEKLLTDAHPIVLRNAKTDPSLLYKYQRQLANLRSWQGRYADEISAAKAGLALAPLADPKQDYDMHDALLDSYGEGVYSSHGSEMSLKIYTEEVQLAEAARRRWPSDHLIISRSLYAQFNLGTNLTELGVKHKSLDMLQQANAVLGKANKEAVAEVAFEPADRWVAGQWRSIENARAQSLSFMGRDAEAMAIYRIWEIKTRKEWEIAPKEVRPFRSYVQELAMIGEAQGFAKHFAEQCETDGKTLRLYEKMRALGALTKWDQDTNMAELKIRLNSNCAAKRP